MRKLREGEQLGMGWWKCMKYVLISVLAGIAMMLVIDWIEEG